MLHLYTADAGRVGAVAKGVRKTKSRMGGRLEPFSHVELVLHRGRGELATVTGASLVQSHDRIRANSYRLAVGTIGLEATLRLFTEEERNERAFLALTRFLDALDQALPTVPPRPAIFDPLILSFQLKLLWISGYLPHLGGCVECGAEEGIVGFSPAAGGAVCTNCETGSIAIGSDGLNGIAGLLRAPIADAPAVPLGEHGAREAHLVVTASYEHHGGFRLKTA